MTQQNFKALLRDSDLKVTPARIAVLEYLKRSDKPLDVASIISYLENKNLDADPATIFRIVNVFTEKGITRQVRFDEDKFRYELSDLGDHHHLICQTCGSIDDISDCGIEELEKKISQKKKFIVKHHSLEFFGLCTKCQQ